MCKLRVASHHRRPMNSRALRSHSRQALNNQYFHYCTGSNCLRMIWYDTFLIYLSPSVFQGVQCYPHTSRTAKKSCYVYPSICRAVQTWYERKYMWHVRAGSLDRRCGMTCCAFLLTIVCRLLLLRGAIGYKRSKQQVCLSSTRYHADHVSACCWSLACSLVGQDLCCYIKCFGRPLCLSICPCEGDLRQVIFYLRNCSEWFRRVLWKGDGLIIWQKDRVTGYTTPSEIKGFSITSTIS